ncbi:putative extracellular serine-rich protein [Lyophyllum shimeji]|uniref:Extracellular serine-rich protein n=1 Tax=Lyophyllum shimeji TaxID=47721 RepID=A0A9P3PXJ1_LYOSH|nr:putative extracellular serine-rich protein [Lyophyllum shimeji]
MVNAPALGFVLAALPAALAATIDVSVGASGKFAFDPQFVTAQPGDMVNFMFHPKNHTVTQSSFDQPCVPLAGGKNKRTRDSCP